MMMALAMTAYLLSAQVGANPLVILGLLGLLLVLLAGFWHHERRTKYPLMVPEIWQNLVFRRNVTATFINFLVAYSFTLLAPLYLQLGLGYTSQTTGLLLMIPPLVALVVNPLAGILVDRVNQPRWQLLVRAYYLRLRWGWSGISSRMNPLRLPQSVL